MYAINLLQMRGEWYKGKMRVLRKCDAGLEKEGAQNRPKEPWEGEASKAGE